MDYRYLDTRYYYGTMKFLHRPGSAFRGLDLRLASVLSGWCLFYLSHNTTTTTTTTTQNLITYFQLLIFFPFFFLSLQIIHWDITATARTDILCPTPASLITRQNNHRITLNHFNHCIVLGFKIIRCCHSR